MADRATGQGGVGNGIAHLLDVSDDRAGLSAGILVVLDPNRGDAVEILTADRDTITNASKRATIGGDGRLQSLELVGKGSIASRRPHAEEQVGASLDSGRDSRDRGVGSCALHHGVETRTGKAITWSANKLLRRGKQALEVRLLSCAAIGKGRTVVEALRDGSGGGNRGGQCPQAGGCPHDDSFVTVVKL